VFFKLIKFHLLVSELYICSEYNFLERKTLHSHVPSGHSNETRDLMKNGEFLEKCAPLRFYVALKGYFLPTFRDSLSAPSSNIKSRMENFLTYLFSHRTWRTNYLNKNNFFLHQKDISFRL